MTKDKVTKCQCCVETPTKVSTCCYSVRHHSRSWEHRWASWLTGWSCQLLEQALITILFIMVLATYQTIQFSYISCVRKCGIVSSMTNSEIRPTDSLIIWNTCFHQNVTSSIHFCTVTTSEQTIFNIEADKTRILRVVLSKV